MISLTYRTNDGGRWGAGLGADLSASQIDMNFWTIAVALQAISVTEARGISSITQPDATHLLVTYSDATTAGPFLLPTSVWNPRGAWAPSTAYSKYDVVYYGLNIYVVLIAHTSPGTFSAGYLVGGSPAYQLMMAIPHEMPVGGSTGQVLAKIDGTDYNVQWTTPHYVPAAGTTGQVLAKVDGTDYNLTWVDVHNVPAGGTSGQVLTKVDGTDYNLTWATPAGGGGGGAITAIHSASASMTFALSDANTLYRITTSGGTIGLTIPSNATAAIPIGSIIEIRQEDDGKVQFIADTGVTLDYPNWADLFTGRAGDWVRLVKVAANEWNVTGDLIVLAGFSSYGFSPVTLGPSMATIDKITVTRDLTLNAWAPTDSRSLTFLLVSNGTAHTVTFNTNFRANGTVTTGGTTGQVTTIRFEPYGGLFYEVSRVGPYTG